ncbi:MAG TPA: NADP-dependent oxidoreductase [Steroidobacteraceae bacterium]|nr:NADP-dependent oxidoreductase [Steroidobacteraceae bacterium]
MAENNQIVVRAIPDGKLEETHFERRVSPVPVPAPGQVLVKNRLISQDAANRAWMRGATYRQAVQAGDVMHAYTLGEVLESRDPSLAPGDLVLGEGGWQEFYVAPARKLMKMPRHEPVSHLFSLIGVAGKTAYHGLVGVGRPKAGETVVVSAAAGSVGIFVGQIAKALGCRAVGIAGGAEKCRWLVEELGFDAAVDYKAGRLREELAAACPKGIDVYFDNVGGKITEAVLFQMNPHGRIACCGVVSQYDAKEAQSPAGLPGLLVVKRLRMEGFIVMDFAQQDAKAEEDLLRWAAEGKIKVVEDIIDGLENAPRGLIGLLAGENRGKRMIRLQ